MKLRISVENRTYDVEVDVLDHPAVELEAPLADAAVPEAVLRPRPPQRLPEDRIIRSPIAGRVAAVLAEPIQEVRHNQPVLLLDAMKMEVPIGPAVDGTVQQIHVKVGDTVTTGQVLFEMAS